jgi:hypothetical protein
MNGRGSGTRTMPNVPQNTQNLRNVESTFTWCHPLLDDNPRHRFAGDVSIPQRRKQEAAIAEKE